jgi:hypothetical protein
MRIVRNKMKDDMDSKIDAILIFIFKKFLNWDQYRGSIAGKGKRKILFRDSEWGRNRGDRYIISILFSVPFKTYKHDIKRSVSNLYYIKVVGFRESLAIIHYHFLSSLKCFSCFQSIRYLFHII